MKSNYSNLTPEIFERACGGSIRAQQVTQSMLDLASTISRQEAKNLNATPSSEWWQYETIDEIERAIPHCKDRHIQAVLTVGEVWGNDGWDNNHRVASEAGEPI